MPREWSDAQRRIFDWFESGTGNLRVEARAGSSKTTSILEGINHAPERRILLCAFNKKIADELNARLQNPYAKAQTMHSVGYGCIRRYWEGVRVDDRVRGKALTDAVCGGSVPDAIKRLVTKLHGRTREALPLATTAAELLDLAEEVDCRPDDQWEADGFSVADVCGWALEAMNLAASEKPAATGIDFADMVYLPIRNRWLRPTYDLVIQDEAQDASLAQLAIMRGVCSPTGRIAIFGDSKQAIYGWRSVPLDSMDRLAGELRAATLPLYATYRCGKAITRRAAEIVPDFTHGPDNPEGVVRTLPSLQAMLSEVRVGDAILSRKNAPLAGIAMALLRDRKRVAVSGKDIGAGLQALVRKLATGRAQNSMPEWLSRLSAWEEREVVRAEAMDRDDRIEGIRDKAETLRVLAEGALSVHQLDTMIGDLFQDGLKREDVITCSTCHRFKGLESPRVYQLEETFYPPSPCAKCRHFHGRRGRECFRCGCPEHVNNSARQEEESHLEYVATTRAISELVLVGLSKRRTWTPEPKEVMLSDSSPNLEPAVAAGAQHPDKNTAVEVAK
jgi:DNA helicase-2/ATP-dependent DNA helicase PcrA